MKNLRKKVYEIRQKLNMRRTSVKVMIVTAVGFSIPLLTDSGIASATDVNDTLGFGNKIDPVKIMKSAGGVAINIASVMAVGAGVVFLIQAVQSFMQAKDSHDSQQMMQGFSRLFIGIGLAAAGGIAFYFVNLAK